MQKFWRNILLTAACAVILYWPSTLFIGFAVSKVGDAVGMTEDGWLWLSCWTWLVFRILLLLGVGFVAARRASAYPFLSGVLAGVAATAGLVVCEILVAMFLLRGQSQAASSNDLSIVLPFFAIQALQVLLALIGSWIGSRLNRKPESVTANL